jgi:hypothetical protein
MDKRTHIKAWALYTRPIGTLEWRRSTITDDPKEVDYFLGMNRTDDMYEFMSVIMHGDYPASWDEVEDRT